jgi:hypothetical protein
MATLPPDCSSAVSIGQAVSAIIAAMITKRQLGFMLMVAGVLVIFGACAVNWIGARDIGFGPLQKIGLAVGGGFIIMALPLIKLGDRPA